MPISELSPNRGQLHVRAAKLLRLAAASFLAAQLVFFPVPSDAGDKPTSAPSTASRVSARVSTNDPVLKAMQTELSRAITELGTPDLDNTHGQSRSSGVSSGTLPLGNDQDAIARVLWELTDREYKRAVPALMNVRTDTAVRAEEEDKSPDFSKERPETHVGEADPAPFDRSAWEGEIKRLSAAFRKYPDVYFASVVLQVTNSNSRMVSTEGTTLVSPSSSMRLVMEAQTRADDGMDLLRVETFQAPNATGLPGEAELT